MAMVWAEVLGAIKRRRRWHYGDKVRIVEESFAAGVTVTDVAQRRRSEPGFHMASSGEAGSVGRGQPGAASTAGRTGSCRDRRPAHAGCRGRRCGAHASEPSFVRYDRALGSGRRLRVDRDVDADALRRVLDVLDRR
jgi:transposase